MKLLFETWRRFLKEDIGYFGESFVEFKRRTESGEHPLKVANEMLDFVGKGSTRMVFGFPDNKTHLLKIINVETIGDEEAYAEDFVNPMTGFTRKHKTVSNENEADLKMQSQYPGVFPRSYEYSGDYSWILTERVEPIDKTQLAKIFNIPTEFNSKGNLALYRRLMEQTIMLSKRYTQDPTARKQSEAWADDLISKHTSPYSIMEDATFKLDRPTSKDDDEESQSVIDPFGLHNTLLHATNILRDSHNSQIFRAAAALGIPPRELTAKNLGISNFGQPHLVILDASLWEYEETPAKTPALDNEQTFNF